MTMGGALGVDQRLLASVLPAVEAVIVDAICGGGDEQGDA